MVFHDIPVARATAETPPCPRASASAAARSLRRRSSTLAVQRLEFLLDSLFHLGYYHIIDAGPRDMAGVYDVVVVGGGTAGTIACVQAGRAGAGTLLVEKNGLLGGTTVIAGVTAR